MTAGARALIAELNSSLTKAPKSKQVSMLRAVVDLYLRDAEAYSKEQVEIFDDVISRLIKDADRTTLIELSGKLAPIRNAMLGTMKFLSLQDDVAISGAVLSKCAALQEADLIGIAKSKGQFHLTALADRAQMSEVLTDILVDRGNIEIANKIARNRNAKLSEFGFAKLIKKADNNRALTAVIADRKDLPQELRPFLKTETTTT
jgi:uncharacterized protein (DUF2336 family)